MYTYVHIHPPSPLPSRRPCLQTVPLLAQRCGRSPPDPLTIRASPTLPQVLMMQVALGLSAGGPCDPASFRPNS